MALITCPECGNQVSDKAAACPKCGAPIAAPPKPPPKVEPPDPRYNSPPPIEIYNPKQDQFLTRNRGCGEVFIWAFVALLIIAGLNSLFHR